MRLATATATATATAAAGARTTATTKATSTASSPCGWGWGGTRATWAWATAALAAVACSAALLAYPATTTLGATGGMLSHRGSFVGSVLNLDAAERLRDGDGGGEDAFVADGDAAYAERGEDGDGSGPRRNKPGIGATPVRPADAAAGRTPAKRLKFESPTAPLRFANPSCDALSRRKEKPGFPDGVPAQYVHIPKTGGTTIQETLMDWSDGLGLHTYLHNGDHETNWACSDPGVGRGIMLGHRGFGYCARFAGKMRDTALFITALREPVSRFRSLFDYIMLKRDNEPFRHYHEAWLGRELNDIVLEYNRTLGLGLRRSDPRLRGAALMSRLLNQQVAFMCGWDCVAGGRSNVSLAQTVRRALENLERADAVAVMEKLDDLVAQLRFHTQWVPIGVEAFPADNVFPRRRSSLTPDAVQVVRSWSAADVVLYERALERHEELTNLARKCVAGATPAKPVSGRG